MAKWAQWTPELCRECCRLHCNDNPAAVDVLRSHQQDINDDETQSTGIESTDLTERSTSPSEDEPSNEEKSGKSNLRSEITSRQRTMRGESAKRDIAVEPLDMLSTGTPFQCSAAGCHSTLLDVQQRLREAVVQRYMVEAFAIMNGTPVHVPVPQFHTRPRKTNRRAGMLRRSSSKSLSSSSRSLKSSSRSLKSSSRSSTKLERQKASSKIDIDPTVLSIIESQNVFGSSSTSQVSKDEDCDNSIPPTEFSNSHHCESDDDVDTFAADEVEPECESVLSVETGPQEADENLECYESTEVLDLSYHTSDTQSAASNDDDSIYSQGDQTLYSSSACDNDTVSDDDSDEFIWEEEYYEETLIDFEPTCLYVIYEEENEDMEEDDYSVSDHSQDDSLGCDSLDSNCFREKQGKKACYHDLDDTESLSDSSSSYDDEITMFSC